MPIVPLGIGANSGSLLPPVVLRNLYLESDKSGISPDGTVRVQRPGLSLVRNYPAVIRGVHHHVTTATSEQLVASGSNLYSGTANIGMIGGTGLVGMASTPFATVIRSGDDAYLYEGSLEALPMPDDAPRDGAVQDVDQLNGYGLFLIGNGRFYWLEPGDTEIDPLNYATAESLPDDGVAIRRLGDEIWIFGAQNVEVWQSTGDQDAPFQRAAGRSFERGCLYRDTVRRFDNTLVWVGDDYQVYRAVNVPQVISDPDIARRIRRAGGECSAWTFGVDGHDFYVLRVPGQGTLVYDASTKLWCDFSSLDLPHWLPWVGYQDGGTIYAGSSGGGALWRVEPYAGTDAGQPIERIVSGTVAMRGRPLRNDSISIGVSAIADTAIRVRWADGQDELPSSYEDLSVRAPQDVTVLWRLGSTDEPLRRFEVSSIAPERIAIYGMIANEGWK